MVFNYLLKDLPEIFFPPLYITSLLWCIGCCYRKKYLKARMFVIIASVVLFAFGWRLSVISLMVSKRYSAILIYPMLFFTVAFCLKIGPMFRLFAQKYSIKRPWIAPASTISGSFLAVILFFICSLKCLRIDSNARSIKILSQTCAKHAERVNGPRYFYTNDPYRLSYYAKIPLKNISHFGNRNKYTGTELLLQRIQLVKNIKGHHYIFGDTSRPIVPTAENLKLSTSDGHWKILQSLYKSSKKKIWLGYFKAGCPNIQEWKEQLPPPPKKNLFPNGNFEEAISQENVKKIAMFYQKSGILFYNDLQNRILPMFWSVNINSKEKKSLPDVTLSGISPLAGKYSLTLSSHFGRIILLSPVINYNGIYSFFVRNNSAKEADLRIYHYQYNQQHQSTSQPEILYFRLQSKKIYRISGRTLVNKKSTDKQYVRLAFYVQGNISVDQFSINSEFE